MGGTGTAIFSQNNGYTGGTTINAGAILEDTAASNGLGTGAVSIVSGGELLLSGATLNSGNTISLAGTGVSSAGAIATIGSTANVLGCFNTHGRYYH